MVVGNRLHVLEMFHPCGLIGGIHASAIGIGLGDDFFFGNRASFSFVQIKQIKACTIDYSGDERGEAKYVVNATVQAHATFGAVQVCRITGDSHATGSVLRRHSMVHPVDALFQYLKVVVSVMISAVSETR